MTENLAKFLQNIYPQCQDLFASIKKGLVQPTSKKLKIIHTLLQVEVIITLMSVMLVANNR